MPLDHEATAAELEAIHYINTNFANRIGSVAAARSAKHTADILLGLADWHREQAAEIQRKENLYQLHQAAEKTLIQTN